MSYAQPALHIDFVYTLANSVTGDFTKQSNKLIPRR